MGGHALGPKILHEAVAIPSEDGQGNVSAGRVTGGGGFRVVCPHGHIAGALRHGKPHRCVVRGIRREVQAQLHQFVVDSPFPSGGIDAKHLPVGIVEQRIVVVVVQVHKRHGPDREFVYIANYRFLRIKHLGKMDVEPCFRYDIAMDAVDGLAGLFPVASCSLAVRDAQEGGPGVRRARMPGDVRGKCLFRLRPAIRPKKILGRHIDGGCGGRNRKGHEERKPPNLARQNSTAAHVGYQETSSGATPLLHELLVQRVYAIAPGGGECRPPGTSRPSTCPFS